MEKNIERIKQIFETESKELLDQVEQLVLQLESQSDDVEALQQIFRNIHSIKGTAGMFGMEHAEHFLHAFEDLLDLMRNGNIQISTSLIDLILNAVDQTQEIVSHGDDELTEEIKSESDKLIAAFKDASGDVSTPGDEKDSKVQEVFWTVQISFDEGASIRDVTNTLQQFANIEDAKLTFVPQKIPTLAEYTPGQIYGSWLFRIPQEEIAREELESLFDFVESCNYKIDVSASPVKKKEQNKVQKQEQVAEDPTSDSHEQVAVENTEAEESSEEESEEGSSFTLDSYTSEDQQVSIRVDLQTLENLMNKVSELVLNRNQLLQYNRNNYDGLLNKYVTQLDRLTSEIQETTMNTRMEPVGNSWTRLPRIVRELSKDLGKNVDLKMKGQSTELDRQIMEKLKEPLVHIIRNAIDHGIEAPAKREANDKPKTGILELSAYSSAGNIFIKIRDDGGGINAEKIKSKVTSNGLLPAEEAEKLTEQETFEYLFKPGFSTAGNVSELSGRGVGLDVVKKNIEQIGGQIDVDSELDHYTEFTIKIPLTLAVISAMTIETGGKKFAISQLSVAELVWLNDDNISRVEKLDNQLVYRLRDTLVPIVDLNKLLNLSEGEDVETGDITDKTIVFIEGANTTFGILVDTVDEIQEIVVKPLSRTLNHLQIYSGCTIVGNEEIVLILDVNGICSYADLTSVDDGSVSSKKGEDEFIKEKTRMLVFTYHDTQKAVPLELVSRLEEFDHDDIEKIDEDYVIQYRGDVLPLIPFREELMQQLEKRVPVLVLDDSDQPLGIVVEEFEDVVETRLESNSISAKPGILSVEVIEGKTTEVIDLNWFYQRAKRIQLTQTVKNKNGFNGQSSCVLVEPSKFIRSHVKHVLNSLGLTVKEAEDLDSALEENEITERDLLLVVGEGALRSNGWKEKLKAQKFKGLTKILMGRPLHDEEVNSSLFQLAAEDYSKEKIVEMISRCTLDSEMDIKQEL